MEEKLNKIDKLLDNITNSLDIIESYLKLEEYRTKLINKENKNERDKCFNNFSQSRF